MKRFGTARFAYAEGKSHVEASISVVSRRCQPPPDPRSECGGPHHGGGGGGGAVLLLAIVLLFTVRTADAQTPLWSIAPTEVMEGAGSVDFVMTRPDLISFPISGILTLEVNSRDGTAVSTASSRDFAPYSEQVSFAPGSATSLPITVSINDDSIYEGDEHFFIDVLVPIDLPGGGRSASTESFRITIKDNDRPPSTDIGGGMHAVARAEALVDNQPRLIPVLRNPGTRASQIRLSAGDGGIYAAGGFQAETVWGATSLSRTNDEFGEHEHLLATLGAHFRMSKRLHLGGMLQFDRTGTEPGGVVVSGEFEGNGWMVGPYFAARDASQSLYFEGRLLYGRSSNDVLDYVPDQGEDARSVSLDSERWLIQGRVEGMHPLGNGMTLIPLADFSHARDEMEAFVDSRGIAGGGRTVAVTKLQLGAEFEIPVETAKGDLIFSPGLRMVVSDLSKAGDVGNAVARTRESAEFRGRIDFGIDYRLEDDLVLGFESFYSGNGRENMDEFESYGAGLKLQFEF